MREPWMADAACRGMDTSIFFPTRASKARRAMRVCSACPVAGQCADYQTRWDNSDGVWAGVLYGRTPLPDPTIKRTEPRMLPTSLSASSIQVFEQCPARFKAEYIDKGRAESGSAASLGTACHAAIEAWVRDGHYLADHDPLNADAIMQALYDEAYWALFADESRWQEGLDLCKAWLKRQDWSKRKVVSTEEKRSFDIPTSAGPITFNYIMDRLDEVEFAGEIIPEVVDIKSYVQPMPPDALKQTVQARLYALAAQLRYPDAPSVMVVFDLLRHEPIGLMFSKEENRKTWKYLVGAAERVLANDGTEEILGDGCRWCVRKGACEALERHAKVGGPLGIDSPAIAAKRFFEWKAAIGAMELHVAELEKYLLDEMKQAGEIEANHDGIAVSVAVSGKRSVDPRMARPILGDALMAQYGGLKMSDVDALLKGNDLDAEQKAKLRAVIQRNYGAPRIKAERSVV